MKILQENGYPLSKVGHEYFQRYIAAIYSTIVQNNLATYSENKHIKIYEQEKEKTMKFL